MNTNQPKVAILVSRFPKLTETFVLYEAMELEKLGLEVAIFPLQRIREKVQHFEARENGITICDFGWLDIKVIAANLRWIFTRPVRYFGTWLRAIHGNRGSRKFMAGAMVFFPKAVAMAERARSMGIRHIHAHFASHPALAAWIIHQLTGLSYSFTAHGTDLHVHQDMLSEKARDAAFAVTISRYNRDFIAGCCGETTAEKFKVIHCGVDTSLFRPRFFSSDPVLPLRILCVASFREVKGHRYLLDACVELAREKVAFHCRLVGDGEQEFILREQIKDLNLESLVTMEGPQPRDQIIRILGESDVLVLTSIQTASGSREGIPVSIMEGMACGLPVVASRLSGIPELVEDGVSGLLVTPGDPISIAAALRALADDPELRNRMGRAGRKAVENQFNLSDNAAVLAGEIRAVINDASSKSSPHSFRDWKP